MDRFAAFPGVEDELLRGDTKMSIRLNKGLQIDLRVVPAESFGAALQYFTGSKQHNIVLRGRAKDRKLKINEYGVFRTDTDPERYVAGATEEEPPRLPALEPAEVPDLFAINLRFNWNKPHGQWMNQLLNDIDAAEAEGASVVGLSALLTTTMTEMKGVVDLVKSRGLDDKIKVVVGGAPLSKAFADEIGADAYGYDAANAVEIVKELIA